VINVIHKRSEREPSTHLNSTQCPRVHQLKTMAKGFSHSGPFEQNDFHVFSKLQTRIM
jgi:hypothetical protein